MTVQPLLPVWAIVAGFLLLLAGLGWLEIRNQVRWLPARLTALVFALTAIAGLLLRPALNTVSSQRPILLLTKGYVQHQVDSLRRQHPDWQLFRTPDTRPYSTSRILEDLLDLSLLGGRVQAIMGEGLPAYALEYFPEKQFQYFPSPLSPGMAYLKQKQYRKGQHNQVEGRYMLPGSPVKLLLKSPSHTEDSLTLTGTGSESFSLDFIPKSEGKWLYELLVTDSSGNLLDQQQLPLVVEKEKQLHILILQAYPTFEIRYLKDFLAAKGHALAVRSQVSRDRYRTEFANQPAGKLDRLDKQLMEQFDLVLMDGAAYAVLNKMELPALEEAVQNGIGFLGLLDGDRPAFNRYLGLTQVGSEPDTVKLAAGLTLPAYPISSAQNLEWYPIDVGSNRQITAAYHYRGKGKVGYQATSESYTYLLKGDSLAYAALWTPLLEKTARTVQPAYTIELLQNFPVSIGEPLDFRVVAAQELGEVYADSLPVPMREDDQLDEVWYGRTWPKKAGWHRLETGDAVLAYYAFPEGSWPSLATAQKTSNTQGSAQSNPAAIAENYQTTVPKAISRIWFYLLFLIGAGFLWLAPKL